MRKKRPTYEELLSKLAETEGLLTRLSEKLEAVASQRDTALLGSRELEEAYIESEQNFRNSMDASPLGVRIVTEDGELIYANQAILDICGYGSVEELKAVPRKQLYTPESYAAHQERTEKRKRGEHEPPEYEISIRRPDGAIRNLQVFRREVIWGGEQQFMAMYQDITERKLAEEALRESEEKFSRAFRSSPDRIAITTLEDGKFIEVNDSYIRFTGYTREEVIGRSVVQLGTWIKAENRARIVQKLKEEGQVYNEEVSLRLKSGEIRTSLFSAEIINIRGEPCMISVATDITDRKRAEEALRLQMDFNKSMLDTAQVIMMVLEPDGRIVTLNPYLEEISGYKLAEVHGKYWFDTFIPERDRERIKRLFDRAIDNIQTRGNINPILTKDGREREIEWYDKTLKDINGKVVGLLAVGQDVTERKLAEGALRRSEEKYRSVVELIPDGILTIDKSGIITTMNKAVFEITGFSEEEVVGQHISKVPVLSLKDVPKALAVFGSMIKGKGPMMVEIPCRKKDGTPRIGEFRVSLLKTAGKNTGIQVIARDITERNKAEEALLESEERFRKILENAPFGYYRVGKDGLWQYVNPVWERMHGLSYTDVVGKSFEMTQTKTDVEQARENVGRSLAGETITGEFSRLTKSGEIGYHSFNIQPVYQGQEITAIEGFISDITARKQAEERINHLVLTLRSIRNVNQLITREKDRGRLIQGICDALVASRSFNSAWIVLLDESRNPTAWAGANIQTGFPALVESFKKWEYPLCVQKALKQKQVVVTEDPPTMCPGCPILEEGDDTGSMTIRLEIQGTVYGILCASMPKRLMTFEDEISLFKEVAMDIAFALRNIELGAAHELLEQEQLRSAKLESIGTLAGGIAHDFNNLLAGIMGNIGLVKTYIKPSDTAFEMLDEAEKAAVRARDLTQQLLTYARGGKPVKKPVKTAGLIQESAAFALRGSNVRLELSLPDDLWSVEADEGQISQVINNLVINADEAMPSGGILKIEAGNCALKRVSALPLPSGSYVRIDIKDTGMGISQEHLQRIFEPYFTTKQKGGGLGLSTAYSIVKNHGGYILAESKQNEGSTFHIYLPASKKTVKGEKQMAAAKSGQAGGKVLVMDDEEVIRKMLKNMLNLAGYEVELTADGAAALEKYAQALAAGKPFFAVIMDLTIPGGMGGKEAIKKLLEIDPRATAIVSSGYATDPIMSEYKKHGFMAVIAKPYSVKQLRETLSELSRRKKKQAD